MEHAFFGLCHVALSVRDVARSVDFYCDVLGMRIEWKPDEDNVYLTSGRDNLAIHRQKEGATPSGAQTLHHIGFVVGHPEEVDTWAERVRRHDVPLAQAPKTHRDGARSFYFHDPDGILIQVLYHPPIADAYAKGIPE
jgi:catechol 2,3-dioxygenase-like lactoylglutathione lyase family enzyme